MAIAGNEYYDNLDKALKLLASADSQRSTTDSTAGEAMRFYNQFRDSRLSERPTLVDTGALVDYTKHNDWKLNDLIGDDWYGGMNKPLRVASDNQQYGESIRFSDGRPAQYASTTSDGGWYIPDQSNIGIGRLSGQDVQMERGAAWSAPDYFMTVPSGTTMYDASYDEETGNLDRPAYSASNYNTSVELTPEQFDQLQLSMRASLPVPLQLQLLANFYAADNFRLNNTIENILDDYGRFGNVLENVNFVNPDNNKEFGMDANILWKLYSDLQNIPASNTAAYAKTGQGKMVFPMNTAIVEDDDNFSFNRFLGLGSPDFQDIARHELGHALLKDNEYYEEYLDAVYADSKTPAPTGIDYLYGSGGGFLYGLNEEGQRNYPYNSSYGKRAGFTEAFAEDLALWQADKENGFTAQAENIFKRNTGKKYSYEELFPNRAALFDRIFGYTE